MKGLGCRLVGYGIFATRGLEVCTAGYVEVEFDVAIDIAHWIHNARRKGGVKIAAFCERKHNGECQRK